VTLLVATDDERVRSAKRRAEEELLFAPFAQAELADSGSLGYGFENVVGVGMGERYVDGRPTGESSVTVYVVIKAPPGDVEPAALVPAEYDGVPTDVVESGEFTAAGERGRFRPAPAGVSVGHFSGGAGTLGFVARRGSELCIVSNNHVLARENEAEAGATIVQPAEPDGGTTANDAIAELRAWVPLTYDGQSVAVDAAIAETESGLVEPAETGVGPVTFEPLDVRQGFIVRKRGRTTGLTRGHVSDPEATLTVRYRRGRIPLENQFLVRGLDGVLFSARGDSGSLVIEEGTRQPVGLLCGGSPRFSIVTPIRRVLDVLDLSFAA
jgi:hypothetical protein